MSFTAAGVMALIRVSMALVTGVGAGPPVAGENLRPLYSGGLWLAVILMPPARWPSLMAKLTTGVGQSRVVKYDGMPFPAMTSAAAPAKASDWNRVS